MKVQGLFSMRERYDAVLENERKVHEQVRLKLRCMVLDGRNRKKRKDVKPGARCCLPGHCTMPLFL